MNKEQIKFFSELKSNKDSIILQKQSNILYSDSISCQNLPTKERKEFFKKLKEGDPEENSDPEKLPTTVASATTNFITSTMDYFAEGSFDKGIRNNQGNIHHILDHNHSAIAHVGDVQKVYMEKVPLKALGMDKKGDVDTVLMDSVVRKDYNPEVFKFYANGKINQHSIGVRLNQIALAINSKEEQFSKEKEVWDKHYPNVINKELADKHGFFWVTTEADIKEISAVLFGANRLTPTLGIHKEFFEKKEDAIQLDLQDIEANQDSTNPSISEKEENIMSDDVTIEKYIALETELKTLKDGQQLGVAKAVQQERARVGEIMRAAKTFKIDNDLVTETIEKNYSLDMVTTLFTRLAEQRDAMNAVNTAGSSHSSADAMLRQNLKEGIDGKEVNLGDRFIQGLDAFEQTNYFKGVI